MDLRRRQTPRICAALLLAALGAAPAFRVGDLSAAGLSEPNASAQRADQPQRIPGLSEPSTLALLGLGLAGLALARRFMRPPARTSAQRR